MPKIFASRPYSPGFWSNLRKTQKVPLYGPWHHRGNLMKPICKIAAVALLALATLSTAYADGSYPLPETQEPPGKGLTPDQYTDQLRAKVGGRLHYDSREARSFVKATNIRCGTHTYVPLETFLLVGLAAYKGSTFEQRYVQYAGGEIRVIARLSNDTGYTSEESVVFLTANKWGEIRSRVLTDQAMYALCTGMVGPVMRSTIGGAPKPSAGSDTDKQAAKPTGHFAVALGQFDSGERAQEWADELRSKLHVPIYVERQELPEPVQYLLRLGPFESRDQAQAAIAQVRAAGYLTGAFNPADPGQNALHKPE
ncbi:SPOR domain-containing protein [Paraburkholderia sp. MM6662-R1]|uniref:SPOR domain-containing protein n=1 Tax=Paraburkholderia sp. MM6662-R1 TaxID=2991066 RepID=UPI003D235CB3